MVGLLGSWKAGVFDLKSLVVADSQERYLRTDTYLSTDICAVRTDGRKRTPLSPLGKGRNRHLGPGGRMSGAVLG